MFDLEKGKSAPRFYQNLEPYWRSPKGMKELRWEYDGQQKDLSFIPANTIVVPGPYLNTELFYCYDVSQGVSDEELIWCPEQRVARRIVSWFSKEHFDLSVTKCGTEYDIKPIHKYYRGHTHKSDEATN